MMIKRGQENGGREDLVENGQLAPHMHKNLKEKQKKSKIQNKTKISGVN